MQSINFSLTGITSLFMHADDVRAADMLDKARKTPGKRGKAGDDRSPPWSWKTYLYRDEENICWPSQALMAMLRKGGASFKTEGKKTLKGESQASIVFLRENLALYTSQGKQVAIAAIDAIDNDAIFEEHEATVEKLGFVLDVRRASIGTSKNVRVRPKFLPGWRIAANAMVDTDRIPEDRFRELLIFCGSYVGLGDWRPSSPKSPGPHGRFDVKFA